MAKLWNNWIRRREGRKSDAFVELDIAAYTMFMDRACQPNNPRVQLRKFIDYMTTPERKQGKFLIRPKTANCST